MVLMKLKIHYLALIRMTLLGLIVSMLMTSAECPLWSVYMVSFAIGLTYPEPTFVFEETKNEPKSED